MSDFLVDASLPRATGDVIRAHGHQATTKVVLSLVEQFLNDAKVMANLPGHLAIVEPSRIRVRPPI
jgi:hypothetical protein